MPESTLQLTGQGSMERQHCMKLWSDRGFYKWKNTFRRKKSTDGSE